MLPAASILDRQGHPFCGLRHTLGHLAAGPCVTAAPRPVPGMRYSGPMPDPADIARLRLGEDGEELALATRAECAAAAAALARQARRGLEIWSRDLDPALYDRTEFLEAVRALVLGHRHARVRAIVYDARAVVRRGHRLVELARQLPSYVELRTPPPEDYAEYPEAFLVADGRGVLRRPFADRWEATACFDAPLAARDLLRLFDEAWDVSTPDPELRRLHL